MVELVYVVPALDVVEERALEVSRVEVELV